MITGNCLVCNREIIFFPSKNRKYCSKVCMGIGTSGDKNPNYGRKHTKEEIERMRIIAKDRWKDSEYRDRVSNTRKSSDSVRCNCLRASLIRAKSEEAKLKERFTNEETGRWIPLSEKSDFQLYCRLVWKHTKKTVDVRTLPGWEYKGKAGISGAYHLDHMYSLLECFKQNIPIEVAGSEANLEFIPWYDNQIKRSRCSITKEELYERYNNRSG